MVVNASDLLNPRSWTVKENFMVPLERAGAKPADVEPEWSLLKAQPYRKSNWQPLTWAQINALFSTTCPSILLLVDLLITNPVATAVCDRGFSRMKRIKNEFRTRLQPDIMTDILRIQQDSPSIVQFDLLDAVHLWHQDSQRVRLCL